MPEETDDLPAIMFLIEFVLTGGKGMRWETTDHEAFKLYFGQIKANFNKRFTVSLGDANKPEEGALLIRMEDVIAVNVRALKLKSPPVQDAAGAQPVKTPVAAPGTYGGPAVQPASTAPQVDPNWVPPPPATDDEPETQPTT